ncbi:hypothetical protein LZ30DRAFT_368200 [Colletotrichum cereale]|nr:hypothetical protein LZ30DRAFT_368200 [Colletotrichum cereale]
MYRVLSWNVSYGSTSGHYPATQLPISKMHIHPVLLALGGSLSSLTTATAQVAYNSFGLPVPTNPSTQGLDQNLIDSSPRPTSRPGIREWDTDADVRGTDDKTCGYFSTDGVLATVTCTSPGSSVLPCKNTGKWLCGGRYTRCLEPTAPLCRSNSGLHSKTMCCDTSSPVCGTLLHSARGTRRSGLACLGSEFRTKSVVTLATENWPSFVTDPPSTTTTRSPKTLSATPRGTPSTTSAAVSTSGPTAVGSDSPPSTCTETPKPTRAMTPSSVGTRLTGLVLVHGFAAVAFAFCMIWCG